MPKLEAYKGVYYFWAYLPSLVASILFMSLFLIIAVLHFWRLRKLRTWFCVWFAIGCVCEAIGYAGRIAAYYKSADMGSYIIQAIFIVIAPAFYAASIYMTLTRIVICVKGEHLSLIPIKWLSKTFLLGDFLSLNIQSAASGLTKSLAKTGENIVVAGLIIQVILLGFFFVVAITFQLRLRKHPTRESDTTDLPWKQTLYMIYAVSALIFGRSIFRIVEYLQGHDGYSLTHEWTLLAFDSVPMFIVAVTFWFWYPGYVIRNNAEDIERVQLDSRDKSGRFRSSLYMRGIGT